MIDPTHPNAMPDPVTATSDIVITALVIALVGLVVLVILADFFPKLRERVSWLRNEKKDDEGGSS